MIGPSPNLSQYNLIFKEDDKEASAEGKRILESIFSNDLDEFNSLLNTNPSLASTIFSGTITYPTIKYTLKENESRLYSSTLRIIDEPLTVIACIFAFEPILHSIIDCVDDDFQAPQSSYKNYQFFKKTISDQDPLKFIDDALSFVIVYMDESLSRSLIRILLNRNLKIIKFLESPSIKINKRLFANEFNNVIRQSLFSATTLEKPIFIITLLEWLAPNTATDLEKVITNSTQLPVTLAPIIREYSPILVTPTISKIVNLKAHTLSNKKVNILYIALDKLVTEKPSVNLINIIRIFIECQAIVNLSKFNDRCISYPPNWLNRTLNSSDSAKELVHEFHKNQSKTQELILQSQSSVKSKCVIM